VVRAGWAKKAFSALEMVKEAGKLIACLGPAPSAGTRSAAKLKPIFRLDHRIAT
jgi:hypothetical protein